MTADSGDMWALTTFAERRFLSTGRGMEETGGCVGSGWVAWSADDIGSRRRTGEKAMLKGKLLPTILAVLILLLVITNVVLALGNQTLQTEVSERQQFIAQGMQLEQLNRQVMSVLVNMAMKSNDAELKTLLMSSGINLGPSPDAPAGSKWGVVENEVQTETEDETVEEAAEEESSLNLPLLITLVSLLIWFGFQTLQLARERSNMTFLKANQENAIQESQKVQAQFQSTLGKLAELANRGHAGAKLIVEQLQRQGLSFGPGPGPAPEMKSELKTETKPEPKAEPKPDSSKPDSKPDLKSIK
jgi:hypothetical protein